MFSYLCVFFLFMFYWVTGKELCLHWKKKIIFLYREKVWKTKRFWAQTFSRSMWHINNQLLELIMSTYTVQIKQETADSQQKSTSFLLTITWLLPFLIAALFLLSPNTSFVSTQHTRSIILQNKAKPDLDLDWPTEVGHVDIEGDVVVNPEVKLFTGKAVTVLLNVGPGYDRHLLPRDGASCRRDRETHKHRSKKMN